MAFKNRLFLALLFPFLSFSQIGGKYVYQFLNLANAPRQAALGGKLVTQYDYDVTQFFTNPAAINEDMHNKPVLNYGSYFGEASYGTAAYAHTWDRRTQTIAAGIQYINYGTFDGRDELGNQTAEFTGSEAALTVGYAYNIPWTNLYVGSNAKFISSNLEQYSSWGIAADVGLMYKDEINDIHYGLSFRNMGFQIKPYADLRENLPFAIDAGISQSLEHVPIRWHLTLENLQQWNIGFSNPNRAQESFEGEVTEEKVSFLNNAMRHVIVGAELFPEKGFNIRVGYNFRRSQELKILEQRTFAGISLGFGLRLGKLKFNYSYSRYTLAANTNLFGVMINLNE